MRVRAGSLALLVLAFLSLPTAIVVVLSFSGDRFLSFPPKTWSFQPYVELFASPQLRAGLVRSLLAGLESSLICLVVGLPAALAMAAARPRVRSALLAFLTLGFATPLAVSAVALLVVYYTIGVFGSLTSLGLALAVVNLPFLLYAIAASIEALDPQLEEAAATLGARRLEVLVAVKIPALAPGIVTGTLLVFVLSVTEFIVSVVLTIVSSATLPVIMYGSLRSGPTPALAAAGVTYIALAVLVVFGISRFRSLQQFLFRAG
jgi:putative spermidine/putrescine transport system permease protein